MTDLTEYRRIRKPMPPPERVEPDRRQRLREQEAEREMMLDFGPAWGEERTLDYIKQRVW